MKSGQQTIVFFLFAVLSSFSAFSQSQPTTGKQKVVIITGARFSYPLVQHWIDTYNKVNNDVQLVIESRGSNDPSTYDILIEAYEPTEDAKKSREHIFIARYPVLPVANANGAFAQTYSNKGIDQQTLKQLFFHDIFADSEHKKEIKTPYTIYTRLQKAGVPITFTEYFGFQQKDIKGKAIAGSDEHLLKALLRDSSAVSYLPLTLIYNIETAKTNDGLSVIPVDVNNNNKVTEDEKVYADLQQVIQLFESKKQNDLNNVPIGYLHFSVDKKTVSDEALEFLRWVLQNGQSDLNRFGYLLPEPARFEKEKFEAFINNTIKQ